MTISIIYSFLFRVRNIQRALSRGTEHDIPNRFETSSNEKKFQSTIGVDFINSTYKIELKGQKEARIIDGEFCKTRVAT